jgi:diguanylate cyclase (GGDEF)-like protein
MTTFVAGGGLLYLSRSHLAAVVYATCILVPLAGSLMGSFFSTVHHEIYFNLAVGLGCYWLMLMAVSYVNSKLHADNHQHQLMNQSLLEDLSYANSELEKYICASRLGEEHLFSSSAHSHTDPVPSVETAIYADPVTGLEAPTVQAIRFGQARAYARRHHQSMAVFRININNYAAVKAQYGDETANLLLKTAAVRLAYSKRDTDMATRLENGQFCLVITEVLMGHEITTVVNRIIKLFAEQTTIENSKVQIDASIGISLFSRDGDELSDLIRHAETALAAVDADRTANKSCFQIYDPEATKQSIRVSEQSAG